jgi:hypothetical protein
MATHGHVRAAAVILGLGCSLFRVDMKEWRMVAELPLTEPMQAETLSPDGLLQLGFAYWGSKAVLSAVELGLFSTLARGPLSADQLADRLGVHPRSALDFFDALVSLGMLSRRDGQYANTPETDLFLDEAKPTYVGGVFQLSTERLYGFWGSLTEALRTGKPQNEMKDGDNFFEVGYREPDLLRKFLDGMTGVSMDPLGAVPHRHRHRLRPGLPAGAAGPPAQPPHRWRVRPAAGRADLRRLRQLVRPGRPAAVPPR